MNVSQSDFLRLAKRVNEVGSGFPEAPEDGKLYGRKDAEWAEAAAGDMTGPPSATDGNLVIFDGVTGKKTRDAGYGPGSLAKAGTNQLIQHGFAYIQGNGTSTITKAVAFAQSFDAMPDVVPAVIGGSKATKEGVPANQGDFPAGVSSYGVANAQDITVDGFTLVLYRAAAWSASYYYGASWIAIGTKARS